MEQVKKEREKWLQAFLSGDVEVMKSIEVPSFLAISKHGIEDRSERYANISNRKLSGNWFKPGAKIEDIEISYFNHGDACQVVGRGRGVAKGNIIRQSNFSELWVNYDGIWKVQSIHVSEVNQV